MVGKVSRRSSRWSQKPLLRYLNPLIDIDGPAVLVERHEMAAQARAIEAPTLIVIAEASHPPAVQ